MSCGWAGRHRYRNISKVRELTWRGFNGFYMTVYCQSLQLSTGLHFPVAKLLNFSGPEVDEMLMCRGSMVACLQSLPVSLACDLLP